MQHIDEGTIHAWLDGALPPDEAATVEAHVRSCASCAAAVAEARGMIAGAARIVSALDVSRGDGLPRTPSAKAPAKPAAAGSMWRRLHLTPSRAALAAAILVAVAGTLVVQHQRPLADVMSSARRIDSSPVRPVDVSPSRPVNSPRVRTSAADPVAAPVPAPASATPAPTPAPKLRGAARPILDAHKTRPSSDSANQPAAREQPQVKAMVNSNAILSATERASASSAMTDSLVARPLAKAARAAFAPAAASGARPADNVARLEAVTATGLAEGARCFQLGSLTTDSAFGALPQRFALAGASTTRNVVRSLSAEGRIDSIVPGAEWVQPASNEVIIEFPVAGGVGRMVRLDLGQGRATTQMAAGTAKTVSFSRIDCAR